MNPLFKAIDNGITATAMGIKAFTMTFARNWGQSGLSILPRTRYNYGGEVGQGLSSSIVLAVVGWAMRNFGEAPVRIRQLEIVGETIKKKPVLPSDTGAGFMLKLMMYPNDYYSGILLMQACIIDRMTTANAYIAKVRNASGRVVELWWIPSIYMRPRWAQDGSNYISYYEYNPNGIPYQLKPDDIIHFRDGLDPKNTRLGLNKLAALAREIFTDDEASNFSATLLANLGVPGVIISPENTGSAANNRLVDPEGIKAKYIERFGGDKRGEPLVLTGPTKVQILSFSPEQMGLTKLRRLPEERLTAVFGIPAIVAGLGAGLDRSTFANMKEARAAAWEEHLKPTQSAMAQDLRVQLLVEFADWTKYEVDFDTSEVKALQEDQTALWDRNVNAFTKGGITRRAMKENIGEDVDDTDDIYVLPITAVIHNAKEPPPVIEAVTPAATTVPPTQLPPLVPRTGGATNGNGNGTAVATGA